MKSGFFGHFSAEIVVAFGKASAALVSAARINVIARTHLAVAVP
jgi:hypothetical protein